MRLGNRVGIGRLGSHLKDTLFNNSYFQMASALVPAAISMVFWIFAARVYDPSSVGYVSVLFSSLNIITVFSSLGLGIALIRFLPNSQSRGTRIINTSFTVGGIAAILLSLAFIAGLKLWSPQLVDILLKPYFVVVFIALSVIWTLRYLQSCVFLAKCQSRYTFVLNTVASILKLTFLVVISWITLTVFGLFMAIGLSAAAAFFVGLMGFLPKVQRGYSPIPTICMDTIREIGHYTTTNYLSRTLLQIQPFILPLIAINALGSEPSAYFYMAWTIGSMLVIIPASIFNSLLAVASKSAASLNVDISRSLRLLFTIALPSIALLFVLSEFILSFFGTEYSNNGATVLRLILLSVIPYSMNYLRITIDRVSTNHRNLVTVSTAMTVLSLGLTYYLATEMGLDGMGLGWMLGQTIVAIPVSLSIWKHVRNARHEYDEGIHQEQ